MHVVHRGNNRQRTFLEEVDYRVYLRSLETQAGAEGCDVHAFVLMGNHVHLLLTPKTEDAPARFMKAVAQNFTQYVNRRYRRTGSLWEGRYWSGLVCGDDYFLRCQRYIERNPSRAGIVRAPEDYAWSSCSSNLGAVETSRLATPHAAFLALGTDAHERFERYRQFISLDSPKSEVDEIRDAVAGGFAWGPKEEIERLVAILGPRISRSRGRVQER